MDEEFVLGGWPAIVNRIVRGEKLSRPTVIVGATPELLKSFGLTGGSLSMTVAKVARCRREHPDVPLETWHQLPELLQRPQAIFPSRRRDGSMVILLIVVDRRGDPILVAAAPESRGTNTILSVYGKEAGLAWVANEIALAKKEGLPTYEENDFAASLPQPPVAETTSSSHGLIPSNGTAKPKRDILTLRK